MTENVERQGPWIREVPVEETLAVILMERDIEMFQFVHEQGYVCRSQIQRAFWKKSSGVSRTCRNRIDRLVFAGYLKQGFSGKRKMNVYFASEKAVAVLKKKALDSGVPALKLSRFCGRQITHDLHVTDIRLLFWEMGLSQWTSDRVLFLRDHLFRRPDGVLTIRDWKIAIEFENWPTKGIPRYQDILKYYDDHASYRLLFVIIRGGMRDWLLNLDYDVRKVWFVTYGDLMRQKEKTHFENKGGAFELSRLL